MVTIERGRKGLVQGKGECSILFFFGGADRVKMGVKCGRCTCICVFGMRWGVSAST